MDDQLLIKQMQSGDKHAFDQFYHKYHSYVLGIALKVLANQPAAEDVTQDVFIEVFNKSQQYNPAKGSVKAWIAVKTRSRAIDRLRSKPHILTDKLEEIIHNASPAADEFILEKMEKEILQEALLQLPKQQQQAIYYMYFDQFTQKEISLKTNRPLGSVKSSIRYGLKNLKKQKTLLRWMGSGGGDK